MVIPIYNLKNIARIIQNIRRFIAILWRWTSSNWYGALDNISWYSASFKFKHEIIGSTENDGTKIVETMVPLKYLNNFWRNFEMSLIKGEINFILTWYANCVISNAANNQATIFAVNDSKLYVPDVTLSTQDNAKLLEQIKSGIKRTINWNG